MGIDAIALLKGNDLPLPERLRAQKLDDATLVHTGVAFGSDLEMLAYGVRTSVGDALYRHDDPRGVFVLPDVVAPKAKTYDDVIAEVGEAGEWVQLPAAGEVPVALTGAAAGSFEAMMGQAMQALGGENLAEIQRAIASGDYAAMARLQQKMAAALGGEDALEALATQLVGAIGASAPREPLGGFPELPIDLANVDPAQLAELAKDLEGTLPPEQLAEIERLLKKRS
ncbi:MAG: hypothetical protein HYV09_40985 [Deltaproteobacteria bacterium]|nr:hypothetical protein [Deltaproteobacteria bacterium]